MFLSFCFNWGVATKEPQFILHTIQALMRFCCFLVGYCYIVEARYGASGTSPHLLAGPHLELAAVAERSPLNPHDHFMYNLRTNIILKYGYIIMIMMQVKSDAQKDPGPKVCSVQCLDEEVWLHVHRKRHNPGDGGPRHVTLPQGD